MQIIAELSLVTQAARGSAAEAQMDAIDTYRVNTNTMTQTPKMISSAHGTSAINTPADVAMPLPPLKRSQQVKLWPRTAETPAMIASHSRACGPAAASTQLPNNR